MSVILDALRRARRGTDAPSGRSLPRGHSTAKLPAGLGLGTTLPVTTRPARTRWLAIAALFVLAFGVWAAVQVASRLGVPEGFAPAATRTATARTPTTPAAPIAPAAPIVPPAATAPAASQAAASAGSIPTAAPAPAPRRQPARADAGQFEQGVKYQTAGNLDEAAKHYLAAIAQNDRHVEARNNLGLLYRSRGETALAIEQFRRALTIDPRYVTARNHLAVLLLDAGRVADARRELDEGLSLDPRNVDLLVNLALVEKAERHDERAMELLLRAIGDRPGHAAAHYNLALLYDERRSFALAYDHYTDFLAYAGPEYSAAVADVRRRVQALATLLDTTN
jgi:Flp pilus assembly protein TadD